MKFKVGDRVRVVREGFGHRAKAGMTGVIVKKNERYFGVRFDNAFDGGHDLIGRCENGHGQWIPEYCVELIGDNHKIVITSDGKTTLARLYEGKKVVKSAEANCAPDDEFDFTKGAKIAFERLTEAEEYDYHKAFITLQDYCIRCDECKIEKLAKSKGMLSCSDLISFADIEHKRYSPEYLDNLIAELERFDETDKPKYKEVHRKAKAGEYVRLVAEHGDGVGGYDERAYDRCGIYKVEAVDGLAKIRSKQGELLGFLDNEYVVLEGYKPEDKPEAKPKYYSGKLVCVKSDYRWWTAGKVYEVVNGTVFDDECVERERILDVADMNDKMYDCARFIELKE